MKNYHILKNNYVEKVVVNFMVSIKYLVFKTKKNYLRHGELDIVGELAIVFRISKALA